MKHNDVKEFLQKNAVTISLQLVGILVVFVNLWITTKLSPFATDITSLKSSVRAIEKNMEEEKPIFEEFVAIKTIVKDMDVKLDKLDQRLYDLSRGR